MQSERDLLIGGHATPGLGAAVLQQDPGTALNRAVLALANSKL